MGRAGRDPGAKAARLHWSLHGSLHGACWVASAPKHDKYGGVSWCVGSGRSRSSTPGGGAADRALLPDCAAEGPSQRHGAGVCQPGSEKPRYVGGELPRLRLRIPCVSVDGALLGLVMIPVC